MLKIKTLMTTLAALSTAISFAQSIKTQEYRMTTSKSILDHSKENSSHYLDSLYKIHPKEKLMGYMNRSTNYCEFEEYYLQAMYHQFLTEHSAHIQSIYNRIISRMNISNNVIQTAISSESLLGKNLDLLRKQDQIAKGNHLNQFRDLITETNKTLSASLNALEGRSLNLEQPNNKDLRIMLIDRIAPDPSWSGKFKITSRTASEGSWLSTKRPLASIPSPMKAEDVWTIIRNHSLKIDGIPIDGVQRREYLESLRTVKCRKQYSRSYRDKSILAQVGPSVNTSKIPCPGGGDGISIIEATGRGNSQKNVKFTESFFIDLEGQNKFRSSAIIDTPYIPQNLKKDIQGCGYMQYDIKFQCGCNPEKRCLTGHLKSDQSFTISCDSGSVCPQ